MRGQKRLLSLLLCLCLLPLRVWAADVLESGACGDGLLWKLDSTGTLTVSGSGPMLDYEREHTPWSSNRNAIRHVVIESGATSIGSNAFWNCDRLEDASIADSVTSIGDSAFYQCVRLTSVGLPAGLASIGNAAFRECVLLRGLALPGSLTQIGDSAFYDCASLTSLTIPGSVTGIGDSALWGCSGLTEITIPDGVSRVGNYLFHGCTGLRRVTLPKRMDAIGFNAFWGCGSLESLVIPDGVPCIEWGTFNGCASLTGVTIPESVMSIGYNAFYGCSALAAVRLPEHVSSIGEHAFENCVSLKTVTIPVAVKVIGPWAFAGCESLCEVSYGGSKTRWKSIQIGDCNTPLLNTVIRCVSNVPVVIPTSQKLTVNGTAQKAEIYNIDGSNYFKLRDIAMLLNGTGSQFSVTFDGARNTIVIRMGEAYTPVGNELTTGRDNSATAVRSPQRVEINGSAVELDAFNIGGSNFFQLRELGAALNFKVDYDAETATMIVTSK